MAGPGRWLAVAEPATLVTRQLERLGRFSARHRRTILIISLVVVLAAAGLAATTVQLDMGVDLYLDDESAAAQDWERVESGYDRGNQAFVVVQTDDVTDPATVRLIARLDERYGNLDRISASRSLADVVRAGADGRIPETEAGVERAIERVRGQGDAAATMIGTVHPDPGTSLLVLSYGDVAPPREESGLFDLIVTKDAELIEADVGRATDAVSLPPDTSVTVTGAGIFEAAAFEMMLLEALALFAGGFLVVLLLVYLVMRHRLESGWQAFFALAVALASVVIMLGAMGILGYNFNAIMLTVLPVGLGLSVDYALQIQTRYAAERDAGNPPTDAAGVAARTTGRALALAMGTTLVGFGSLVVSPVPPVRQFGLTLAVNVLAAMLLSLTLLVAILVHADVRAGASVSGRTESHGHLERALGAVGRLTAAQPLAILLLLLPLLAGGAAAYPQVDTTEEMLDYWPQDIEERQQLESTVDRIQSPNTIYVLVDANDPYDPATVRSVARFQRQVRDLPHVNAVDGPITDVTAATGGEIPDSEAAVRRLLARSANAPLSATADPSGHPEELLLTLSVGDIEGGEIRTLADRISATAADRLPERTVTVTGKPVVTRTIIENVTAGLERMTALSFAAAFVFLLVALRSPRDSLLLILAVPATAATLVLGAMYLLDIPWNPGTVSMASIALGIGIDYGLHVHERYSEVRAAGVAPPTAMEDTLRALSRPVIGSGLTTVAGFGVLVFSRFPVVRNFGKTLVLVVACSMFAAFVVLPTVTLALDGRRASRPVRRALTVVRTGSLARDGTVLTEPSRDEVAGTLALLDDQLDEDEQIAYVLTTRGGGVAHSGERDDRYTPGGGRAVAAVTDRGIHFAVAAGRSDGTDLVETVPYAGIWAAEARTGLRTTTLAVTTHGDERYQYRLGGRHDLEPVVDHVERLVERWGALQRHLDEIEDAIEPADADEQAPPSGEQVTAARSHLSAAKAIAAEATDADHAIQARIEDYERRLWAVTIHEHRSRARDRQRAARDHRSAERYEAAHAAFRDAIDAYDRAIDLAEVAPDGDVANLEGRREQVAEALSRLEEAPLRQARLAQQQAAEAEDPAVAAADWQQALDRLRTALYLALGDSPFQYDVDGLRLDVERAAANCIGARRERAEELQAAADAGTAADRREAYAAAIEQLRAARDLAAELRAGDVAALEAAIDRLEDTLARLPDADGDRESVDGEWEPLVG